MANSIARRLINNHIAVEKIAVKKWEDRLHHMCVGSNPINKPLDLDVISKFYNDRVCILCQKIERDHTEKVRAFIKVENERSELVLAKYVLANRIVKKIEG